PTTSRSPHPPALPRRTPLERRRPTMTERNETGTEFVAHWQRESTRLAETGLYSREDERDSCGVGMVVAIDGKPRREVVTAGINALKSVWHRGAVVADG